MLRRRRPQPPRPPGPRSAFGFCCRSLHAVDDFVEALFLLVGRELEELVHPLLGELLQAFAAAVAERVALGVGQAVHPLAEVVPLGAALRFGQIAVGEHLVAELLHLGDDRVGAPK